MRQQSIDTVLVVNSNADLLQSGQLGVQLVTVRYIILSLLRPTLRILLDSR